MIVINQTKAPTEFYIKGKRGNGEWNKYKDNPRFGANVENSTPDIIMLDPQLVKGIRIYPTAGDFCLRYEVYYKE